MENGPFEDVFPIENGERIVFQPPFFTGELLNSSGCTFWKEDLLKSYQVMNIEVFDNLTIWHVSSVTTSAFQEVVAKQHGVCSSFDAWTTIWKQKNKSLPSRDPTLGKGKSSSKVPYQGDMLIPWRVTKLHACINSQFYTHPFPL